jgi:HK97 family phage major capsid protein
MKDKLLKLLDAKKAEKTALAQRAAGVETAEELRSINVQIGNISNEIETINGLIALADESEKREAERDKNILLSQKRDTSEGKMKEYRAIAKLILKREMQPEERSLVTVADNGAILPEDFVNQLQLLRKGFPSLKKYCHVIPITNKSGKMPFATIGTNKLSKLTSGSTIPEGEKVTQEINYSVDDYGKILPIENSLTDDEVVGIIQNIITPEFAEASVLTENDEILAVVKAAATAVTGAASYADVENAINGALPSLRSGIVTITNLTGYVYLKAQKDKQDRPLNLVTTLADGTEIFNGKPLIVLDDADITPTTAGDLIFYVTNIWSLAKFFDRKGYEIKASTEVLFNYNQTAIRVLERFDVQKLDDRACKKIEFAKPVA